MSEHLLKPVFAQYLNTKFRTFLADSRPAEFELIDIEGRASPSGYECFSLLFRAPHDTPVEQRMYKLEHDQMPSSEIFLVPISGNQTEIIFEGVFNRLLKTN